MFDHKAQQQWTVEPSGIFFLLISTLTWLPSLITRAKFSDTLFEIARSFLTTQLSSKSFLIFNKLLNNKSTLKVLVICFLLFYLPTLQLTTLAVNTGCWHNELGLYQLLKIRYMGLKLEGFCCEQEVFSLGSWLGDDWKRQSSSGLREWVDSSYSHLPLIPDLNSLCDILQKCVYICLSPFV